MTSASVESARLTQAALDQEALGMPESEAAAACVEVNP